jgi:hypothetical protein
MVIEDVCKHMPADGSATITNNTKQYLIWPKDYTYSFIIQPIIIE